MSEVPHALGERAEQPDSPRRPPPGIDRVEFLVQGDAADLCLAVAEGLEPPVLPEVRQQRRRSSARPSGSRGAHG